MVGQHIVPAAATLEELMRDFPRMTHEELDLHRQFDILEAAHRIARDRGNQALMTALTEQQNLLSAQWNQICAQVKGEQRTVLHSPDEVGQYLGFEDWEDFKRANERWGNKTISKTPGGIWIGTHIPGTDAEFDDTLLFPFEAGDIEQVERGLDVQIEEWLNEFLPYTCHACGERFGDDDEGALLTPEEIQCPDCYEHEQAKNAY